MSNSKTINVTPAERVSQIKEYFFSRKNREVAELNKKGMDIISLGIGGPDLPPAMDVVDALCESAKRSDSHSYQPYVGLPELRQAFAEWYGKYFGVTLNASQIQPLIGSKEGILHISLAFLNPGDGVLVPNPGYPTYTSVSNLVGADIKYYDLVEENGWMPDFEALEKMPLENVKMMWLNFPNMPTGAPATMEIFEKAVAFGKKHNILIINDNPYSFVLHENQLSILSVEGAMDIAIEMNSLSKSHNMAGWRMGMLAANETFIGYILKVKSNIDSGQFKPMMVAAVKALQTDDSWYEKLNVIYNERRKVAEDIMTALGCKFDSNQKGLFLWGKIPAEATDSITFADKILYEKRVFLTPGSIFGSNGDRFIRISLCAPAEKMKIALERVKN